VRSAPWLAESRSVREDPSHERAGSLQAGERVRANLESHHGQTVELARHRKARPGQIRDQIVLRLGDGPALRFHGRGARQVAFWREGRRNTELDDDAHRSGGGRSPHRGIDRLSKSITHEYTLGEKQQNQEREAHRI
jgi:hypothetical protein